MTCAAACRAARSTSTTRSCLSFKGDNSQAPPTSLRCGRSGLREHRREPATGLEHCGVISVRSPWRSLMKVFFSHSSHYKPLLRELRALLPNHIDSWIDEDKLLIGENITENLEVAIQSDSDFVILFIDSVAARSAWVRKEVEWAMAAEKRNGRTFLLPVVLDMDAWEGFEPAELCKRKHLSCNDFTEKGIGLLADEIAGSLFAWLSRDAESAKSDTNSGDRADLLGDADRFLRSVASEIRTIVYPHRQKNPLEVDALYERLHSLSGLSIDFTAEQFLSVLARLDQQHLLSGLYYDGEEIFVEEEHYSWKIESFTEAKKRIARAAVKKISSGDVIALDAGSTTELIAQHVCRLLRLRKLRRLTFVTNSLPAAMDLLTTAGDIGIADDGDELSVYLAGGRVRPNTMAIVSTDDNSGSDIRAFLELTGGASLAFVGTNGVTGDGFSTEAQAEVDTKRALLQGAQEKIIVTDPSKFGLRQSRIFSPLEGIEILTAGDGYEHVLDDFATMIDAAGGRLTCV